MKKLFSIIVALLMAGGIFADDITVAQALEIGNALESNAVTPESYSIVGYVNVITENKFNESYNNMTFWIADSRGTKSSSSAGALQVYRGRPDQELKVGDKIRVVAPIKRWNSTIETNGTNAPVTFLEAAPEVPVLDTIRGNFRVCAQNLENYYYNLNTGRGNYTEAERTEKTRKIVNMMLSVDADVYAFCELEAQPIILNQLADSANARVDGNPYVAVYDGISVEWSESADYNLKSGFIYNQNRVKTYGSNTGGTSGNGYYAHTMRIQAFEQLSSGERIVVSMNHFKAKDSSSDQGESQRMTNANNLVNSLGNIYTDPDILVLGDFNCEYGEAPITTILNAGYEEQILRFDSMAYSHCYGGGELIDHVFANASMKAQIVCAYVKHVSAYKCNPNLTYADSYSDHDPYVVEINMPVHIPGECEDIDNTYLSSGLGDCSTDDASIWSWNSYGYALSSKQGGYEGNLFTPVLDMSDKKDVNISFAHTHRFAGTPSDELTLWVTKDYKDSYAASDWQQLTINPYNDQTGWTWHNVSIDVPASYVGEKTVFAFHYKSTTSNYAKWEVKNLRIQATCDSTTAVVAPDVVEPKAVKRVQNGQLYLILPDGSVYNMMGQKLQ